MARSAVVPACDQGPIEKTRLRACERAGGVVLLDASRWIVRGRGEAQEVLVRDADAVVLRFCYRQPNLSNTHNAFRFAAGSMSGDISARGAFTAIG